MRRAGEQGYPSPSRRRVLGAGALLGVSAVAGCLGPGSAAVDRERATSRPTLGDPDAPVTLSVFEDFACPHCHTFNENVMTDIRAEYVEPGTVLYRHFDFPIPMDRTVSWQAPCAARSVLGQTDRETFFEYVDRLFSNQASLGPDTYAALAEEVGADGDVVRTAATEERYRETVAADRQAGRDRGVGATPTVFVDGENAAKYGRLGYSGLVRKIEAHLGTGTPTAAETGAGYGTRTDEEPATGRDGGDGDGDGSAGGNGTCASPGELSCSSASRDLWRTSSTTSQTRR